MVCSVSQTMSLIRNINMDKSVTMFLQTKCINCRVVYVYWKPVIFFTLITIPSHPLALCNLAYPPPFRPPRNIYMTLTSLFISQCMGVNLSWPEKIKAQHNKPWEMKGRWKRPTKKSRYFCLGGHDIIISQQRRQMKDWRWRNLIRRDSKNRLNHHQSSWAHVGIIWQATTQQLTHLGFQIPVK